MFLLICLESKVSRLWTYFKNLEIFDSNIVGLYSTTQPDIEDVTHLVRSTFRHAFCNMS